jgi:hypothetical protein
MKFGKNASSTSTNNRAKFHRNLMYRFRMRADIHQTHNTPTIAGLPPIAGTIFLARSGCHTSRSGH